MIQAIPPFLSPVSVTYCVSVHGHTRTLRRRALGMRAGGKRRGVCVLKDLIFKSVKICLDFQKAGAASTESPVRPSQRPCWGPLASVWRVVAGEPTLTHGD